ncbi:MAG: hypothetical protein QG657_3561 [Acidobacteriota bacterium]|nr:hypothetical protein [Acidobacteriota bacterium]
MQQKKLIVKGIIVVMFFLLVPLFASAQWFLMPEWPGDRTRITLKFLHPNLSANYYYQKDLSLFSGIYDLSINMPIKSSNGRVNIEASFPIAVNSIKNETMRGNFYLGIQWKHSRKKTHSITSIGAYLPTGSDDKWPTYFIAMPTDPVNFPKYAGKMWDFRVNYLSYASLKKFELGYEMGLAMSIGDEGYIEPIAYLRYGFYGAFRTGDFTFRTELAGFIVLAGAAGDEDTSIEPFTNSIAVGVRYGRGAIRPSIFYTRCLTNKLRYAVKDALGFQLQFVL